MRVETFYRQNQSPSNKDSFNKKESKIWACLDRLGSTEVFQPSQNTMDSARSHFVEHPAIRQFCGSSPIMYFFFFLQNPNPLIIISTDTCFVLIGLISALWAEGRSKQNGVRLHATDYEIYVSKYFL